MIFLFPFAVFMGVPGDAGDTDNADTGDTGDTGDNGDAGTGDNGNDGAGDDSGDDNGDTGDDQGQVDQTAQNDTPQEKTVPVKALQAEVKKRQELETRLKALESQQPAKQPQTIEEHFDANPAGVLNWLKEQRAAAEKAGEWEKSQEFEQKRIDLLERQVLLSGQRESKKTQTLSINHEIYKAVPDFDTKKAELVALAQELGLSEEDARDALNPEVIGESAIGMAKMLNNVYAIKNAGKTVMKKEVKTPMKTEPAGNGGFSNNDTTKKQFNKAKETGHLDDWAAILG